EGVWIRLAGADAYGTMTKIVERGCGDGSCDTVVLATFDGYWDALSASGLAGMLDCPVLLTDTKTLSDAAKKQIKRLGAKKVYICGGPVAVSNEVEKQVKDLVDEVKRVAGDDAAGTARAIHEEGSSLSSWGDTAIIATAEGYWDALSASPLSYAKQMPIFLANVKDSSGSGTMLDSKTRDAIVKGGFKMVVICGGTAAVSSRVEGQLRGAGLKDSVILTRYAGANAVATSKEIAAFGVHCGMQASGMGVATNNGYWDALTGAALCGSLNAPLILADPSDPADVNIGFVNEYRKSISHGFIFGGTAALPSSVAKALNG
ncbi:MAG: cell wall-binding repeat-containing protein, partial [Eggerthellaceae bacterium]|nr:cell wall-binding repeat-containing protein [Eggerthellaceae bacterium]